MRFKLRDNKYFQIGFTAFLVIAASIGLYFFILRHSSVSDSWKSGVKTCMPIIDGIIIAYLITPIVNWIEKHILKPIYMGLGYEPGSKRCRKSMRVISMLISMIMVLVILIAFFSVVIPEVLKSIQNIIIQFPKYVETLTGYVDRLRINNPEIEQNIENYLLTSGNTLNSWFEDNVLPQTNLLISKISKSVFNLAIGLWNVVIGFIISIYVLYSKEKFSGQFKKVLYAIFEENHANKIINACRFTHRTFIGFISGKIVDSFIIGVICYIACNLMKTPYTVLVSLIVGITNMIPFFGPYLGAIPSLILILMIDPMKAFYFLIFIILLQQVDGNFIGPRILGSSTGLTGFWVIFSITIFGGMWGIFGMIVGVPIFAVLFAGFRYLINQMLIKKELPVTSKVYIDTDHIENKELIPIDPNYVRPRRRSDGKIGKFISKCIDRIFSHNDRKS
ncbi:MAG: AI-2E family transporter [Lachnospiraceae bacterium]|nr:AI-2E family transporter [Lachnospiraceae bacterium]